MRIARLVPIAGAAVVFGCGGDKEPSYLGTWKLNLAESDFGQLTMTYEAAEGGGLKATMDGQSFTFKPDGSDTPTPWGNTVAVKAIDSTSWEQVGKVNGKLSNTDTVRLSADQMTLTVVSHMMRPDGSTTNDTLTLSRKAGERGLVGTWQAQKMNSSSPGTLQISLDGTSGLAINFVEIQGNCNVKFDGSESPATGPMWASGWTCSLPKYDDTSFELAVKKDGNPMYTSSYSVSADGKKLTENGGAVSTTEKVKVVYDRQQ